MEEAQDSAAAEEWDRVYRLTPPESLPWEQWRPPDSLAQLVEKGEITPGQSAVDLGCGLGTNTIYLAASGLQATGVDISRTAVAQATKRAKDAGVQAEFIQGDVLDLPFNDGSFDFALDRGCFHHLDVKLRKAYLNEVNRILKPGAKYLLLAFRSRITPEEIRHLSSPHFTVKSIDLTESTEPSTGTTRLLYAAYMYKK